MDSLSYNPQNINPDSSVDELASMMSESTLVVDQRKQFYASWKIAIDNKESSAMKTVLLHLNNRFRCMHHILLP